MMKALGRRAPTASTTFTNTASPTPTGNLTVPPLGNLISTGDAVNETGKNFGSFNSASVGPCSLFSDRIRYALAKSL